MINEKLHLLLLLSLNKGVIQNDKIVLFSKLLGKSVTLSISDIKNLCEWYAEFGIKEGIINQFNNIVEQWDKSYYPDETVEESALTISNLYRRYLNKVQISGAEHTSEYFFKLYSPKEVLVTPGELRGEFGRAWIDYESQLKESDIICDDIGIWVCSANMLYEVIRDANARKHYGNNIIVLKMLDDQKYLNQNNIEYIGNSYKAVYKQELRSLDDYIRFKDFLSSIATNNCGYKLTIQRLERMITHINYLPGYYDINNIDVEKIMFHV